MELHLRFSVGDKVKQVHVDHAKYIIGRNEDCKLRLKSSSISRHHCCIRRRSTGFEIVDLKSRNGTAINGKMLEPGLGQILKSGDQVQLGSFSFEVLVIASDAGSDDLDAGLDSGLDLRQWLADARSTSKEPKTEEILPNQRVFNLTPSEVETESEKKQTEETKVNPVEPRKFIKDPPPAKTPGDAALNAIRRLFRS